MTVYYNSDRILGKWAQVDRYACCLLRGQVVNVWDCNLNKLVWHDVGSASFCYIPGNVVDQVRRVYGRRWEPQFLLFPAWYFTTDEIKAVLLTK